MGLIRLRPRPAATPVAPAREPAPEPERLEPERLEPDRLEVVPEPAALSEPVREPERAGRDRSPRYPSCSPCAPRPGAETTATRVIVLANQKGGVAKTTTTLNLGVAFHEMGYRVLLIDLDPQGNLTMSQGLNPDAIERSMFDVLVHKVPISEVIEQREVDLAVASIDLAGAELALSALIGRERSLEKALVEVRSKYDFVLVDTPPSLGLLTINAFVAATGVIVPVQCEYLSLRGLVQLENTLAMVRENLNPERRRRGDRPDDVRRPHAALTRGDRDPRGELRRARLPHADSQDGAVRRGAGEGQLRPQVRPDRRRGGGLPRAGARDRRGEGGS